MLLFALFYFLLDLSCGECNVISMYVLCFPVNGSVCFVFLTVWQSICFGVVVILLLNVMELFSVSVGAHRPCIQHGVCCACDPSVHLDAPSIRFFFVFLYVGSFLLI